METSGKVNLLPEELPSTRWETGVVKTRTLCVMLWHLLSVMHCLNLLFSSLSLCLSLCLCLCLLSLFLSLLSLFSVSLSLSCVMLWHLLSVMHCLNLLFSSLSLPPLGLTRLSSHGTNTWSAQSQLSLVDKRQRTRKLRGMLNPVSGSV